MQDLRKKLLEAGLVSKAQARKAGTEKRKAKRRKGKSAIKEAQQQEKARKARYEEKQAEKARRAREKQALLNRRREEREHLERVRNITRSHALIRVAGRDRVFYFLGPDRKIRKLYTTFEVADGLGTGRLAVVLADDDPARDYAVVDADAARKLEELAPDRLLFWNKPGAGRGDLPAYGSGTPRSGPSRGSDAKTTHRGPGDGGD